MKWILVFLFSSFTLPSFGIGGIWILEVSYATKSGRDTTFILSDHWANGYEKLEGQDDVFRSRFDSVLAKMDSVMIYDEIVKQEEIAKAASFPMHAFEFHRREYRFLQKEELKDVKLIKLWETVDYHINVLSHLTLVDTSWIKEKATITYPVGQDVGCRLEVHSFSNSTEQTQLLEEFEDQYSKITSFYSPAEADQSTIQSIGYLLHRLKQEKVVVVELCGC